MSTIKTLKQAKQYGVVTKGNSKIHGSTFSTDPFQCKVGSKLADVKDSTCSKCYARKLAKVYPSALQSWKDNLEKFRLANIQGLAVWCEAIAFQINHISKSKKKANKEGANLHRWFASGDLDSVDMLAAICYVAELTPDVNHWLPTRENAIVRQYLNILGKVPANLTIRISDTMIDSERKQVVPLGYKNITFSKVHKDKPPQGVECPAYKNSGSCGDCTMCWNNSVKTVTYKLH